MENKLPTVIKAYLVIVVLLTLGVGSTIFLESIPPTPPKVEWVAERYEHCWWKHTYDIRKAPELGYRYTVHVEEWEWVCAEREYLVPKEEQWQSTK